MSRVRLVVWHRLAPIVAFAVVAAALAAGRTPDLQTRIGDVEVLSDTQGIDFGPYLAQTLKAVRKSWFTLIPESVDAPVRKKGKVALEFAIKKDGHLTGMRLDESSGNVVLDRAAWAAISDLKVLPALPAEFKGDYLLLRIRFYYNQPPEGSAK